MYVNIRIRIKFLMQFFPRFKFFIRKYTSLENSFNLTVKETLRKKKKSNRISKIHSMTLSKEGGSKEENCRYL